MAAKVSLFCFPYAGGSSMIYNIWKPLLHRDIELVAVELAGRGKRISEPMYNSMSEVVEDVYDLVKASLHNEYALFGHSLGGAIVFSLVQRIMKDGLRRPRHIFFSGRGAPGFKAKGKVKYSLMSEKEFEQAILKLGGTPPEVFNYPELRELFVPLLLNDFRLVENWTLEGDVEPFDCNISVFLGRQDSISHEEANGWKEYTRGACSIQYFDGGHFFLNEQPAQVVDLVNRKLA